MSVCPVVAALSLMRGGYDYPEDDSQTTVKIGGGPEVAYDDATYYITLRRMDVSRFELGNPDPSQCKKYYKEHYANVAGKQLGKIYAEYVDKILKRKLIYDYFIEIYNVLFHLERLILSAVDSAARRNAIINITIGDLTMLPNVDKLIVYRADILYEEICRIIDYINRIDIRSILKSGRQFHLSKPRPPGDNLSRTSPIFDEHFPTGDDLATIKQCLAVEMKLAEYISSLEAYQRHVIGETAELFTLCGDISADIDLSGLTISEKKPTWVEIIDAIGNRK